MPSIGTLCAPKLRGVICPWILYAIDCGNVPSKTVGTYMPVGLIRHRMLHCAIQNCGFYMPSIVVMSPQKLWGLICPWVLYAIECGNIPC